MFNPVVYADDRRGLWRLISDSFLGGTSVFFMPGISLLKQEQLADEQNAKAATNAFGDVVPSELEESPSRCDSMEENGDATLRVALRSLRDSQQSMAALLQRLNQDLNVVQDSIPKTQQSWQEPVGTHEPWLFGKFERETVELSKHGVLLRDIDMLEREVLTEDSSVLRLRDQQPGTSSTRPVVPSGPTREVFSLYQSKGFRQRPFSCDLYTPSGRDQQIQELQQLLVRVERTIDSIRRGTSELASPEEAAAFVHAAMLAADAAMLSRRR